MAKIGEIALSAEENKELIKIFKRIPTNEINPFKLAVSSGSTDVKDLGKRIEEILNTDYELTQDQINIIYKHSPCRYIFDYFSKQVLEELSSDLASLIGKDLFKLMLLVSNKHKQSDETNLISIYKNITSVQNREDESKKKLKEFFNRKIGRCLGINLDDAESSGSNRIAELQRDVTNLQYKLAQSEKEIEIQKKEYQKKIDYYKAEKIKHNEDLQSRDREIKRLGEIITEKNNNINKLVSENKNITEEYKNFKLRFDARLNEEVEKKIREQVLKIFPDADAFKNEINDNQYKDLIEESRDVLNKQAKLDQIYGNRVELNKRLEDLLEINRRLKDAIQHSLNLAPNVQSIANKVEKEIAKIKELLGKEHKQNEYLNLLYGLIGSDENLEQLESLCEFADLLFKKKILSEEEFRSVYRRLYGKYEFVEISHKPKFKEHGLAAIRHLRNNLNSIIILDAHNIINSDELRSYFSCNDHKKTREKFEITIKRLAQGRDNVKFFIVYDGPEYEFKKIGTNVQIYYSGGEGEHRADRFIIEKVKNDDFGDAKGKKFIVTDDYDLANELCQNKVTRISLSQYCYVLKEFKVI